MAGETQISWLCAHYLVTYLSWILTWLSWGAHIHSTGWIGADLVWGRSLAPTPVPSLWTASLCSPVNEKVISSQKTYKKLFQLPNSWKSNDFTHSAFYIGDCKAVLDKICLEFVSNSTVFKLCCMHWTHNDSFFLTESDLQLTENGESSCYPYLLTLSSLT